MAEQWVELGVTEVKKETEKAFCVLLASGEEVWFPKSQMKKGHRVSEGEVDCKLVVSQWICEQKGIDPHESPDDQEPPPEVTPGIYMEDPDGGPPEDLPF